MKRFTLPFILFLLLTATILSACGQASAQQAMPAESSSTAAEPAVAGDPAAGQKIFTQTCAACHGPAGEGVQGLGKDMTTSEFIAGLSDQELVEFIKVGRDPSDPLNTTGVAMPVKGGNPALSDDDLHDVVSYIRTLHK